MQDRGTALEDYTGGSVRWEPFKFYSFKCFSLELQGIRNDATPEQATEREFILALEQTSSTMKA